VTLLATTLVGCVPNSSNPTVAITSAQMRGTDAMLTLRLTNPGGRNLTVTALDFELSEAETGLPLASDTWQGTLNLPARDEASLPLLIPFEVAPLDPDATALHLNGELRFRDRTGFLGIRSLDLTSTVFHAEVDATRAPQ
jgi:hypothetical protein